MDIFVSHQTTRPMHTSPLQPPFQIRRLPCERHQGPGRPPPDRGEQLLLDGGGRADRAAVPRGQGGQPTKVQLQDQEQDVLRAGGREGVERLCEVLWK